MMKPSMLRAAIALAVLASIARPAAALWDHAHGDSANTGFADVATLPATKPSATIGKIGTFAPGAGPVIGPDGTVYLGNLEGRLLAFHADGSPAWHRDLPSGEAIVASPVVDTDGSVYVVGESIARDTRSSPPVVNYSSELHKFNAGGAWLWHTQFPERYATYHAYEGHGLTSAPPNIWRSGSDMAVMVPAVYVTPGGYDLRLIAFSSDGAVLADQEVTHVAFTVTGGNDKPEWLNVACMIPIAGLVGCFAPPFPQEDYHPSDRLPANANPPLPGIAVFHNPSGGAPWVVVADRAHDIVGYTFERGAFREGFRAHDDARLMETSPAVFPDSRTMVGTDTGIATFLGQNAKDLAIVSGGPQPVAAPPARLTNGEVVVVLHVDGLQVLQGAHIASMLGIDAESIAAAAVSRTHVFVSVPSGLITYDPAVDKRAGVFRWKGGGESTPAIGADGRVYALAGGLLHVFPGPQSNLAAAALGSGKAQGLAGETQPQAGGGAQDGTAPLPSSQTFQPPLAKDGTRLYACQDLSGNGCGAPVAASFCQQQGFAKAAKLDSHSEMVKAETLDGQLCTKKKCKVFDLIVCTR
jgi:hypothetical protein